MTTNFPFSFKDDIAFPNRLVKDKEILTRQYKSPYDIIAKSSKNLSISNLLRCQV